MRLGLMMAGSVPDSTGVITAVIQTQNTCKNSLVFSIHY